ncbi:anthocyanidin 5,3-O-glucosyltransferase-like [Triticum dicoccoides]|uniref:anthocyanidin 5,3-O-glucosyltransferase-like n=1 Tax=Triticum dicoccoides TaxID=85692 RepID=UPI00188F25C4|nr:anthocyanidin 5,3-O-glucosyltransferase-like [Triticum dicoccoides]
MKASKQSFTGPSSPRAKDSPTPTKMEKTVVLYPGLAVSHFVPMMRLAGSLLEHGYAVSVAMIIDPAVMGDTAFAAAVGRAAAAMPSVRFHTFPPVEDPPMLAPGPQFLASYFHLVRRYNDRLHDFLCYPKRVHAVVVDSLSVSADALEVTKRLGIPGYVMFTSGAASLAAFAQLPYVLGEGSRTSFRELGDAPVEFLGVPPVPASHLFAEVLEDPESDTYKTTMAGLSRIPDTDGILVNTVESLEARAVAALRDPQCLPAGLVMPPVYCVGLGPLLGGIESEADERHECLAWLDAQPDRSVVFLCFGSTGAANHSAEQLKEIATGLEKSGHRFLWVVRAPHGGEPDLDALLPDGFLERTGSRGRVVEQWAPQAEVLLHGATGAFVTHCGWNSVLEGVAAGVPMLCWPLHAEQKMNKLLMVGEMGLAAEMVGWQRGLVEAAEVERKVRLVMESEEGRQLRARTAQHQEGAAAAWSDGGSSSAALALFLSDVDRRWQARARGGEAA